MDALCLHDKREIESFLRRDVYLHIYSIGDLDDFFWPYTTWYGRKDGDEIRAIALLYTGLPLPTLLALSEEQRPIRDLLRSMIHLLPGKFYAHLSPGLEDLLEQRLRLHAHGMHLKMALTDRSKLEGVDGSRATRLSRDDLDDLVHFYRESHPGNWFDPRMLETGQYFGIRQGRKLVSVAGVHVFSGRYRVAALGNIATRPDWRGRGYGRAVTARLCQSLCRDVDHVGLNVKADNRAAVALYEKLGFQTWAGYGEFTLEAR